MTQQATLFETITALMRFGFTEKVEIKPNKICKELQNPISQHFKDSTNRNNKDNVI